MTRPLTLLFAIACGLSVANVYYAQPLLDALARDFNISEGAVGVVVTATQIGCALALLFVVPLGDLLNRRSLMLGQLLLLCGALILVASSHSALILLAGMLAVGMLGTAMTQGLIAYAATSADPAQRGQVVGAAQGGVVIGLLMARVLAGVVADQATWRAVYFTAAAIAFVLLVVLWRVLPRHTQAPTRMPYTRLLGSMSTLLREQRVLQIRGVLAMLMFAAFNIFWTALVLPLSAPPYSLSHTAIGAFGLAGVVGALAATRAGHWADRGLGQRTTGVALALLLLSWLPLAFLPWSLTLLVIGIVLLDLGGQAIHVTNQSMIFRAQTDAPSRLVACYMMFYSVGSGAGAIASTRVYAAAGWTGVCVLGAGVSLLAGIIWITSLRYMPTDGAGRRAVQCSGAGGCE